MNIKSSTILLIVLATITSCAHAKYDRSVTIAVTNYITVAMYVKWQYEGDYFRRTLPAATEGKPSRIGVKDWRLFHGFSKVHAVNVEVGQQWGIHPETKQPLVFTTQMINAKKECWGIEPDIAYLKVAKIPGEMNQGNPVYFDLRVQPKQNKQDNNNWWPSFVIKRVN